MFLAQKDQQNIHPGSMLSTVLFHTSDVSNKLLHGQHAEELIQEVAYTDWQFGRYLMACCD